MSSPRVYWCGRIHPRTRIGGYVIHAPESVGVPAILGLYIGGGCLLKQGFTLLVSVFYFPVAARDIPVVRIRPPDPTRRRRPRKLLKCAGPQNVADALTKSLPRPALAKHRQYMWDTRIPFSTFYLSLKTGRSPTASHNIITPCVYQVARAD